MPAIKSPKKSKLIPLMSLSSLLLFFLLLAGLILPASRWASSLEQGMFQLASGLLSETPNTNEIIRIRLPENVFSQPSAIRQLTKLVRHVSASGASAVALSSNFLPVSDMGESGKGQTSVSGKKKHGTLNMGPMSQLAMVLKKKQVFVSSSTFNRQGPYQSSIKVHSEDGYYSGYMKFIPDIFLPEQMSIRPQSMPGIYPYDFLPMGHVSDHQRKGDLLWLSNTDRRYFPGLALSLLTKHHGADKVIWQQAEGIAIQQYFIETGLRGDFYYSLENKSSAQKNAPILTVDEALNSAPGIFKNKIVVMAGDSLVLEQLYAQLNSLLADDIYITPAWLFVIAQGLLLLVFIYLLFVPGFYHNSGYILTLLFLLLASLAQYSLLLSQHYWLPLSGFYIYLLLGQLVVSFNIRQQYKINRIKQQSYNALWKLGEYQFYQGDYDKALSSLVQCKTNDDVLALLYDIGQNYERRRQYDRATAAYKEIQKRQKNYLDIKKRLQTLQKVSDVQNDAIIGMQSADTLVLHDSGLELPELGRYKIEKELGRGAMGVVYLGRDPKINRQVAIKTLNYSLFNREEIKSVKQRFYREAEAAGRLNHPNIVTVYDLGEEDDFSFIAMDYVQGKSLGEYTRADKLLPVDEVLRIAVEVAETLDYAHSQNIVHRDIKPSNIMYNPETGQIKITDFGIARITDNVKTRTGSFMGSPSYMSPEQMTAQHVDGTSDIYALGVSMYQLLTGQLPFVADSLGNLAYKITHEKHRPIREIREELPSFITRIINKALQKSPQKRYQSGMDMAQAIKRHISK